MEGGAVGHNIEMGLPKPGRDGAWVGPFQNCVRQPALHSRWLLLLKIEISSVVHCCFSISQNRGKDLNVIFYQNMSNLYNQYKSIERKNSQKNPEYMLIYSLSCSCS
jgi:hypothetical protein